MRNGTLMASILCWLFGWGMACPISEPAGYEVLSQQLLQKYSRPVTVLILGDYDQYYTDAIAQSFDAICVSLVTRDVHKLQESDLRNKRENVVILNPPQFAVQDIAKLGSCEHFDVVVVRNFVDGVGGTTVQKKQMLEALLTLGDFIVVEMPTEIFEQLPEHLVQGARVLGSEAEELFVLFSPHKKHLSWRIGIRVKKSVE
jgi:hypothetical protein